jgi:hypothetical protein
MRRTSSRWRGVSSPEPTRVAGRGCPSVSAVSPSPGLMNRSPRRTDRIAAYSSSGLATLTT